ncbi:Replication protein C N-terminal domain-containing protein [Salipiger thiooxidans]|uniref:Replication protein C N-terminal domain-containing protein n=1 Tax=Salipiger thiooxidans TaxID=282683 RepID=A0A1G7ND17_9RHOB|nr:replication initiation protein RepC [Salipiger thiooxidans]SDF71229.1 Replication protein C N-terminal domain-containing protein [Salipiger thiooxidans]
MIHLAQAVPTVRQPAPFPSLPQGMERDGFVALIDTVAPRLGVRSAALATLRILIAATRPSAFKTGEEEPCCYLQQSEIAKKRQVSPSRIRADEAQLVAAGLIEKRTMGNGARSGFVGCGVFFSSAIRRCEEFLALREEIEESRRRHAKLRGLRSLHKKHLKSCLAELTELTELAGPADEVQAIATAFEGWPSADKLHRMPVAELEAHVSEADALCTMALDQLQALTKTRGGPHENERSYIQDTTQYLNEVPCNVGSHPRSAVLPTPSKGRDDAPPGDPPCRKQDDREVFAAHKSTILTKIPIQTFIPLASDDMRFYLDMRRQGRGGWSSLHLHDFTVAAQCRLPELGITQSAWRAAVRKMGAEDATWCVFIIDAKASNVDTPILNPGGYLRAMTRRHEEGALNIVGGLIGLSMRRNEIVAGQGDQAPA